MADAEDPPDDFYAVLGVDSDASAREIRAAYRERAKETHPDQSDAPDASERFQRVKRAEEVLTDPAERRRYDRLGHEQYVGGPGGTDGAAGSDTGSADPAGTAASGGDRGAGTEAGGRSGPEAGRGRSRSESVGQARSARGTARAGTTGGSTGQGATADSRRAEGSVGSRLGRGLRFFDRQQLRIGTSEAVFGFAAFFLYPIFLASSVLPTFPLPVNLLLGLCLLCTVGYLLATPEVGVIVFGAWTLFGPVIFLFTDRPLLSWSAFFLVATTAIPFALCLVVREVLEAPTRR